DSPRKVIYTVLIPALIGSFILMISKFIIFPDILAYFLTLREYEDGSLPQTTRLWADAPADVYYNFYLWNITNPDEMIYEGAMPRVQEVGPYTYLGQELKENLTWSSDGNEVSYRNRRFWHFNSSMSCPTCREEDRVIVPNVAYSAMAAIVLYNDMPIPLVSTILDVSILVTGSAPIQTVPVGDLLFNSFDDPLISLQTSTFTKSFLRAMHGTLFGFKLPDYPHPGLLPLYNQTYEPETRVKTGKANIEELTKIVSYGGKRSMEWFSGEAAYLQRCNDGAFNKLFLQREDKIHIFQSYLGRSFTLEFHKESTRDSVPTFVYRLEKEGFNTNAEHNVGMRYENVEQIDYAPTWPTCPSDHFYSPNNSRCINIECSREDNFCDSCCNGSHYGPTVFLPPGFYPLRVFPGRLGRVPFAIFMSSPHMLGVPKEVSSLYAGQNPSESKHIPMDVELNPTMGTVMHAHMRVQMNIAFAKADVAQSKSLANSIAPIFWLHIEVKMRGDEIASLNKMQGLYLPRTINWLLAIHFLIALVFMSILFFYEISQNSNLISSKGKTREIIRLPRIFTVEKA
ncbi:hypothetical protein PMAYCL1PPCAC_03078, partial [Pristionchus mayeri]